ncbi:Transcription initiation factor TFIID subunit 6 [Astathelohania contejeani]|uniref:Transcription initiation factor TFIID subunit 6 n=1 Tax=Astathelohania contejeani TaxID=164912 RepID=A0ABQ7I0X0_9MICR|nr:Transcription initiation factor TFIID subunit 6 [Thelohania contejeani]
MLFNKETLKSYAQSKGLQPIEEEGLRMLAQDLEYRIKELCQEASKFMLASKRTKLSIDDVNFALLSRNVEPLFGYDPNDSLVFRSVSSNVYYVPDEEVDLEDLLNRPLPKIPLKPSVQSHWLAIEGVQPKTPQNPIIAEKPVIKKNALLEYQENAEIKNQVKHVLSRELQLYYDRIISFISGTADEKLIAIECLGCESGIQQLVPYFIQYFKETITKSLNDSELLKTILLLIQALLKNQYIFIDPYLHQILPSLLTCVVGKSIKEIEIRKMSSEIVKYVYEKFSSSYKTLAPRVINTLTKTWLDTDKTGEQQYGAVFCLSILSNSTIEVIKENLNKYEIRQPIVEDLLKEILKNNNND